MRNGDGDGVGMNAHNTKIWKVLDEVMDPEVPVISVVDLGIVRDVIPMESVDSGFEVIITPTYSGCPATLQIENDIRQALDEAGFVDVGLKTQLAPAWTSDWMSEKGRQALKDFGIAPPVGKVSKRALFGLETPVPCPHCDSGETNLISEFGSTACKALWKCNSCGEPFDYFKCI